MAPVLHAKSRGRKAAAPALRLLAALVASLLTLSSLGQVAHFLLVPHAICADHGELIEVAGTEHASAHESSASTDPHADPASHDASDHDHCELVASQQRQVTVPTVSAGAVVPAASSALVAVDSARGACPALALLAFAPKTSPPRTCA